MKHRSVECKDVLIRMMPVYVWQEVTARAKARHLTVAEYLTKILSEKLDLYKSL